MYAGRVTTDALPPLIQGIGGRIAIYRDASGKSQVDLASAIGRSVPWLSQVERGVRAVERLSDLVNIANACGCTVQDLLGGPIDSLTPGPAPRRGDTVAAVREVMMRTAIPISTRSPLTPVTLDGIGDRVAQAWLTWHTSPTAHSALGRVLPDLIADANTAYLIESDDRRRAARTLSGTWQITRQWLHHLPEAELSWVAAERALATAREADDPHLLALGAWAMSASYRRAGQQEEATRICLAAAAELQRRLDREHDDVLLGDLGMLHLAAAISSAQSDEAGRAWNLHSVADDAARALGAKYDPWTMFGSGNVAIHGLAVAAELGDADAVVDHISRLDVDRVPSVERRARVLIDAARGYTQRKEDEAAVLALLDAEKISADEVHHSTLVREIVREILLRDHARARAHVRALAKRCGLLLPV